MTFNLLNYNEICHFIDKNSRKPVKIVAVSKNHPFSEIKKAIDSGIRIFGENRVQEASDKFLEIKKRYKDIELHLTGPLQTNKIKLALKLFEVIQTLDREKLAKELSKNQSIIKNKVFFIQINTGKESNKSGVYPEDAKKFIEYCKCDLNIPVKGLMCIPPQKEKPKIHFEVLKNLAKISKLDHLSMGMSADFKEGILSGASYIRVGTKIFGDRF